MILDELIIPLIQKRAEIPIERAMLVGISGIDGSGKGYIARQLNEALGIELRVATINVDGWLNLPPTRFGGTDPSRHFYEHALRLEEMFDRLVIPLVKERGVTVTADFVEETADVFRLHEYSYDNIDVVLLEGIFIFKTIFQKHFDLRIWLTCNFETALKRAVLRSQEGLSPETTQNAYENIYFPAQRIHFELDDPETSADILIAND